jgi:hypothetical protein
VQHIQQVNCSLASEILPQLGIPECKQSQRKAQFMLQNRNTLYVRYATSIVLCVLTQETSEWFPIEIKELYITKWSSNNHLISVDRNYSIIQFPSATIISDSFNFVQTTPTNIFEIIICDHILHCRQPQK